MSSFDDEAVSWKLPVFDETHVVEGGGGAFFNWPCFIPEPEGLYCVGLSKYEWHGGAHDAVK